MVLHKILQDNRVVSFVEGKPPPQVARDAKMPVLLKYQQPLYENVGDVPNVAFPCAALYDELSGRVAIYYSGADTATAVNG